MEYITPISEITMPDHDKWYQSRSDPDGSVVSMSKPRCEADKSVERMLAMGEHMLTQLRWIADQLPAFFGDDSSTSMDKLSEPPPKTTLSIDQKTHSNEGKGSISPRVEFPVFDGENPNARIGETQRYFQLVPTLAEENKVLVASVYFSGKAKLWFQSFSENHSIISWEQLTVAILEKFDTEDTGMIVSNFDSGLKDEKFTIKDVVEDIDTQVFDEMHEREAKDLLEAGTGDMRLDDKHVFKEKESMAKEIYYNVYEVPEVKIGKNMMEEIGIGVLSESLTNGNNQIATGLKIRDVANEFNTNDPFIDGIHFPYCKFDSITEFKIDPGGWSFNLLRNVHCSLHVKYWIRKLSWVGDVWFSFWSQQKQQCAVYACCEMFGLCNDEQVPFCKCLMGNKKYISIDYYQLLKNGGVEYVWEFSLSRGNDKGECESDCMKHFSCTTYVFGEKGCSVWTDQLSDMRKLIEWEYKKNMQHGPSRSEIAKDMFWEDGKPFRISGGNLQESRQDNRVFDGFADIISFLNISKKLNFWVISLVGLYNCEEWDLNRFPAWVLVQEPPISLRSSDLAFLDLVKKWWGVLLSKVLPLLYSNRGPIIIIQAENGYGLYGDDKAYLHYLVKIARKCLRDDIILCTTDGGSRETLEKGTLSGDAVFSAVNFTTGDNPWPIFKLQEEYNMLAKSHRFSNELYNSWLTNWGGNIASMDATYTAANWERIITKNGSAVHCLAHGGTNFGFCSITNTGQFIASMKQFIDAIKSENLISKEAMRRMFGFRLYAFEYEKAEEINKCLIMIFDDVQDWVKVEFVTKAASDHSSAYFGSRNFSGNGGNSACEKLKKIEAHKLLSALSKAADLMQESSNKGMIRDAKLIEMEKLQDQLVESFDEMAVMKLKQIEFQKQTLDEAPKRLIASAKDAEFNIETANILSQELEKGEDEFRLYQQKKLRELDVAEEKLRLIGEGYGCILWDLAASDDHAQFMVQNLILDILLANFLVSQSLRITEISLGKIGNLVCYKSSQKQVAITNGLIGVIVELKGCRVLNFCLKGCKGVIGAEATKAEYILAHVLWFANYALKQQLIDLVNLKNFMKKHKVRIRIWRRHELGSLRTRIFSRGEKCHDHDIGSRVTSGYKIEKYGSIGKREKTCKRKRKVSILHCLQLRFLCSRLNRSCGFGEKK